MSTATLATVNSPILTTDAQFEVLHTVVAATVRGERRIAEQGIARLRGHLAHGGRRLNRLYDEQCRRLDTMVDRCVVGPEPKRLAAELRRTLAADTPASRR